VPGERIGNRRTAERAVRIQTVPLSDGEQSSIGFPPRPLTRNCGGQASLYQEGTARGPVKSARRECSKSSLIRCRTQAGSLCYLGTQAGSLYALR
jgi:hypothetical protein